MQMIGTAARDARHRPALRIGMVGAGAMGRAHSLAYRTATALYGESVPDVVLTRVVDTEKDVAAGTRSQYGWLDASSDWRTVTRGEDIDLVDIVTPNCFHAEVAIDALEHGKHVICEKPMADHVEAAARMYGAAAHADALHRVGFPLRCWPAIRLAETIVAGGEIGPVVGFRGSYLQEYGLDPGFSSGWRAQRAFAGSGSLGDLGSHLVDLARLLVGDVERVAAHERSRRGLIRGTDAPDVDDACNVLLEFDGGRTGFIETDWAAPGHKMDLLFEVIGRLGAIQFAWASRDQLIVSRFRDEDPASECSTIVVGPRHPGARRFLSVDGAGMGIADLYTLQAASVLVEVASGELAPPDFLDGLRVSEIIDAALRAAASREWVDVGVHHVCERRAGGANPQSLPDDGGSASRTMPVDESAA